MRRPGPQGASAPLVLPSEAAGRRKPVPSYRIGTPEAEARRRPVAVGHFRVCSIDPGLDRLSLAYFDADERTRFGGDVLAKRRAFTHVAFCTSAPPPVEKGTPRSKEADQQAVPHRLARIGRILAGELRAMLPGLVLVERPAIAGVYRAREEVGGSKQGAQAIALQRSALALGGVYMVCAEYARAFGATLRIVPPSTLGGRTKEERLAFADDLLGKTGRAEALPNRDDADAFAVGLGADWTR